MPPTPLVSHALSTMPSAPLVVSMYQCAWAHLIKYTSTTFTTTLPKLETSTKPYN